MCMCGLGEELGAQSADLGRGQPRGEEAVETLGFLLLLGRPLVLPLLLVGR